jgi:hypothetical protein
MSGVVKRRVVYMKWGEKRVEKREDEKRVLE